LPSPFKYEMGWASLFSIGQERDSSGVYQS
jgi:hypothetical protein